MPAMPCPLCNKSYSGRLGISQHLRQFHAPRGHFEKTQTCILCNVEMEEAVEGWIDHCERHCNKGGNETCSGTSYEDMDRGALGADEYSLGTKRQREEEPGALHNFKREKGI